MNKSVPPVGTGIAPDKSGKTWSRPKKLKVKTWPVTYSCHPG